MVFNFDCQHGSVESPGKHNGLVCECICREVRLRKEDLP